MFTCVLLISVPGASVAELFISRHPSLVLLLLSSCLFGLAAMVQRLTQPAPTLPPSVPLRNDDLERTSL